LNLTNRATCLPDVVEQACCRRAVSALGNRAFGQQEVVGKNGVQKSENRSEEGIFRQFPGFWHHYQYCKVIFIGHIDFLAKNEGKNEQEFARNW